MGQWKKKRADDAARVVQASRSTAEAKVALVIYHGNRYHLAAFRFGRTFLSPALLHGSVGFVRRL